MQACGLGRDAHRRLLIGLAARHAEVPLDMSRPSRLPGWTVGHLLTHLARNADSHRRMIEGAGRGEVLDQYLGGAEGRDRDIDDGAVRTAAEILADARTSIERLEAAWADSDWRGSGRRTLAATETPIAALPFLRVREVTIHHVDLDIGLEFEDLDPLYVQLELDRLETSWWANHPDGPTELPDEAVALSPPGRLAWLMGRAEIEGLASAEVF